MNYRKLKPKTVTLFDFLSGRSIKVGREIAAIHGSQPGPNLVFIGGMHGNEPTGVLALHRVMSQIERLRPLLRGNVYGLAGNLTALARGERYISDDLNRVWQAERVERVSNGDYAPEEIIDEVEEQIGLWGYIDELMRLSEEPFIFIDMHTTSVKSVPFITMSDTLMNRKLAKRIPVPVVIGIEEYLDEPLLSYVNELGYASMAFEAGQHHDPESIRNHEAIIWLCLVYSGAVKKIEIAHFKKHYHLLKSNAVKNHRLYEIRMREGLNPGDEFRMKPGYRNFQAVARGEVLATKNDKPVAAPEPGLIFMPLYQTQGDDGFFLIRRISKFWMGVSFIFRRLSLFRILGILPGIGRYGDSYEILVVDTDVARWYSVEILHLMGYRRKKHRDGQTLFLRRKYDYRGPK